MISPVNAGPVRLRQIEDSDEPALIAMLTNEELYRTNMVPPLETEEAKHALFLRLRDFTADVSRFAYGAAYGERLVGMIHEVAAANGEVEVGYFIDPTFKGRGFASAALAKAIELLFASGFRVVKAGAFEENAASMRVMYKCGMRLSPERETVEYRGKKHECIFYSIENAD